VPAIGAIFGTGSPSDAAEFLGRTDAGFTRMRTRLRQLGGCFENGEKAVGQGKEAAAEFQKILDHSGIVWNCWTGALAYLGVGRANALQARTSTGADADAARVRALGAYKHFLNLWKDADSEIPILKEAQAEYARLQ